MDTNEPPGLDKDELYKGVLLLHLRLAKYAGPAACNVSQWCENRIPSHLSFGINVKVLEHLNFISASFSNHHICYIPIFLSLQPPSITTVNTMFELFDFDNSGQIEEDEFLDIMIILCSQIATRVFFQWALTILIVPFLARNILAFIVFLVGSEYFKFALVDAMKEGLIKNIVLGLPFTMISTLLTILGIPAALDYTDSFFFDVAVDLGQGESNKADQCQFSSTHQIRNHVLCIFMQFERACLYCQFKENQFLVTLNNYLCQSHMTSPINRKVFIPLWRMQCNEKMRVESKKPYHF